MRNSLSTKVVLAVFTLVASGGIITGYLVFKSSANALQSSISSSQANEAKESLDKIDRFLYERMIDMQSLAGRQQIQNLLAQPVSERTPDTVASLVKQMADFKNTSGAWSEVTFVDAQGVQPLPSNLQDLQNLLVKQPSVLKLYADALNGRASYSDALSVIKGHEPVMLFMAPIHSQQTSDHPIIGVMVGELAWQSNIDILSSLKSTHATLINNKGLSLGDNQPGAESDVLSLNFSNSSAFKDAQKTGTGSGIFPGLDDPRRQYLTSYIKENGYLDYHGNNWTLVLETPKSVAFAPANHLAKTLTITFSGILILSVSGLLAMLRLLVLKPISQLEQVTRRLSKGDFSLRTTIKSRDELGNLSNDFNDMADSIQFAYKNLHASTKDARNEKNILETLLENLPIGVLVVEAPSGKPVMVNKVGKQIIGRGFEGIETIGAYTKAFDIIKEDGSRYPNDELPLIATLNKGEFTSKSDMVFRRPDGAHIPVRVADAPIRDADGVIRRAVSVFEDISKERSLERSREEFFSIASHELRTPLTAIMGNSSLIQQYYGDKLPDDDAREMVSDIHESSLRLIEIVNDFLDTSRLEQKHMKFETVSFDPIKIAKDVVKEYQVTGSRKKIHLGVKQPLSPLPLVSADQNRSKQVLINLVGNALKFTDDGSVTISFLPQLHFLKILITDTGRGMSPESQKILFHKFEQTGSTVLTRDSVRGTGLGLYISKMMVEQMGGSIRLESSVVGVGTTFSFSLPLAAKPITSG